MIRTASPTDSTANGNAKSTATTTRKNTSGSETQFPGKLHHLMFYVESMNLEHIICWVNEGRAFLVRDSKKLTELLPVFFSQTKYRSFRRQLNMWHFERLVEGPFKGAFQHPYFLRDNKTLCRKMSRDINRNPWKKEMQYNNSVLPIKISDLVEKRDSITDNSGAINAKQTVATATMMDLATTIPQPKESQRSSAEQAICTIESALTTAEQALASNGNSSSSSDGECDDDDDTIISLPQESTMNILFDVQPPIQSISFKDGDCVPFEGRQFHFVDYDKNSGANISPNASNLLLSSATSQSMLCNEKLSTSTSAALPSVSSPRSSSKLYQTTLESIAPSSSSCDIMDNIFSV